MRYLVLVLLVLGCTTQTVAPRPSPMQARAGIIQRNVAFAFDSLPLLRFAPFFAYGALRLEVEACSGLQRDGWPAFYIASINPMPGGILAFYNADNNSIVFGLGSETVAATVRHELLHFLLAPHIASKPLKGESHNDWRVRVHPDSIFSESGKCGSLLSNPGR